MQSAYKTIYKGDAKTFGRTLLLYGGQSAEREISLQSGSRIFEALQTLGVDVCKLDMTRDVISDLQRIKPDNVFVALHGPGGEDGKVQAVLESLGINYTGSGHAASALAMDKGRTKQVWQSLGLPTPNYEIVSEKSDWKKLLDVLGGEVFVKPAHEGSSIGMSYATCEEELKAAFELAVKYDSEVLVEKRVKGAEYSVTILGKQALSPIRLQAKNTFYDYEAKYLSEETQYLCPCGLSEAKEAELKALSYHAFKAVGCRDWGRVDVMADEHENFYLLEVNTVPGMTSHSLVPMAAAHEGLGFEQLVAEILALAVEQQL